MTSVHHNKDLFSRGRELRALEHLVGLDARLVDRSERDVQHQIRHPAVFPANVLHVEHHETRVRSEIHGADHTVAVDARRSAKANDRQIVEVHDCNPQFPTAVLANHKCGLHGTFFDSASQRYRRRTSAHQNFRLTAERDDLAGGNEIAAHAPGLTQSFNSPSSTSRKSASERPVSGLPATAQMGSPAVTAGETAPNSPSSTPRDHSQQAAEQTVSQTHLQFAEQFHARCSS